MLSWNEPSYDSLDNGRYEEASLELPLDIISNPNHTRLDMEDHRDCTELRGRLNFLVRPYANL